LANIYDVTGIAGADKNQNFTVGFFLTYACYLQEAV